MEIEIADRKIGDGHPVFFVAEAGVNHNGSTELGLQLIDQAAEAGVDAVKFQTFRAENLNTRSAPKSTYHIETTGDDKNQTWFELLKTQEIDCEMHVALMDRCRERGIIFLSTPYDSESADLLEGLGVPAFKLASTDTTNLPLIRHVACKGKPLILSTAMCEIGEVDQAITATRGEGLDELVVLQCTGNYPAALEDSNIRVMNTFRERFNCLVGFSDHNEDLINPLVATAMGACIYEKHFTLDKNLPGPDHQMALSPKELKETVQVIRDTELALGSAEKYVLNSESENRLKLRKSLVSATGLEKGSMLMMSNVAIKRPGTGIPPGQLEAYVGKKLAVDVAEDVVLEDDMFE